MKNFMGVTLNSRNSTTEIPKKLAAIVADEHELIRKLSIKTLKKLSFDQIYECSNGKDAKDLLLKKKIDLILCNVELPVISGYDVLETLRNLDARSDIPFIVLTGSTKKDDIIKAADHGADDYVMIPFQAEDLESKIKRAVHTYFNPSPTLEKIRLSENLIKENDLDSAQRVVETILQSKASPRAAHLRAYIEYLRKNSAKAIELLKENIAKHPEYTKNYTTLTNIYLGIGEQKKAAESLSQELAKNPKQPLRHILQGNLLIKMNAFEQAITHFREALKETPKNSEALYGMGHALAGLGKFEKAIYYFKRQRKHHPGDPKSLRAILKLTFGTEAQRMGEIAVLDEIKAHPGRPDASYVLSEHFIGQKDYDKAKDVLEDLCLRHVDYIRAFSLLAKLYILKKEHEKAIELFTHHAHSSTNPDVLIGLAQVYFLLGKPSLCISTLHLSLQKGAPRAQVLSLMLQSTYKTKQLGKSFFLRELLLESKSELSELNSFDSINIWADQRMQKKNALEAS